MTAHALGSTPPTPPASRGTPAGATQDPATPGHFDQQLHAARQRSASRDSDTDHGKEHAPSAREPNVSGRESKLQARAEATPARDPGIPVGAPGNAQAMASAAAMSVVGTLDSSVPDGQVPSETASGDDQGAAALAGAMLALIGPAVAGVLRSAPAGGAAEAPAQAGKTVATGNVAAMLASGAAAATANPAPAVLAGMLAVADGLLPGAAAAKEGSSHDAAPTVALTAPSTAAVPAAPPVLSLPSPVGSHAFAQELGQQVAWLGGQDIKQARIRLNPEELGSLDVKISVTHGRVDVAFTAQHPGAVVAVQQSLQQLDHMLAQHGLSLGHAEVGQHDRGERHGHAAERDAAADDAGEIHGIDMTTPLRQIGLVDAFA
jgi:flagellar hook-length control protein FliK